MAGYNLTPWPRHVWVDHAMPVKRTRVWTRMSTHLKVQKTTGKIHPYFPKFSTPRFLANFRTLDTNWTSRITKSLAPDRQQPNYWKKSNSICEPFPASTWERNRRFNRQKLQIICLIIDTPLVFRSLHILRYVPCQLPFILVVYYTKNQQGTAT